MESKLDNYTPLIETALDRARQNDVYTIVRLQDQRSLAVEIMDGRTEGKTDMPIRGMGISVFTKEGATGFAAISRLDEEHVKRAVDEAASNAKTLEGYEKVDYNKEIFYLEPLNEKLLQEVKYGIDSKTSGEIEETVKQINKETKSLDDRMSVKTLYGCADEEWRIARTDGTDVTFNMPRSRIMTILTLKEGGNVTQAHFGTQGMDLGVILDGDLKHLYNKRAKSTTNLVSGLLNAGTLKGGHYKALLSHHFVGVKGHEALGHPFETDLMENSIVGLEGKLKKGEKIAPDNISYIDGPIEGISGNQFISANGVIRKTVELVKNGVIMDALSDVFSAKKAGVGINGCGRAQYYSNIPICRMSVTRMVDNNPYPLNKSFEDVTLDDLYEILVKHSKLKPGETIVQPVVCVGGQVNTVEGNFVFNGSGIYEIKNPKKITLYKQSIYGGDTLGDVGTEAKGIGKVVLDGAGRCGKEKQSVPVSTGGNMFFVVDKTDHITFGGQ